MTAYTFETIVAAQALAFDRSADTLTFTTPGTSASNTQVIFDPNHAQVEVISAVTGRAVVFGAYFSGVSGIRFPDGTTATIGGSTATPGGGAQAIFGTTTTNTITGGDGPDTIVGGGGYDTLEGGAGADLFITHPGDSPAIMTNGVDQYDIIRGFQPGDHLSFGALAVTASNYAETTATPIASSTAVESAFTAANAIIGAGTADVVAVEYQGTVLIFVDSKQDNGVADDLISLPGRTLNDIDLSTFVTTPARPAFSSAGDPQASAVPTVTTTGGGRITGNMDTAHISTLLGEVIDNATSTNLTISGKVGFILGGSGFAYDVNEQLTGGLINHVFFNVTAAGGVPFQADLSVTPTQAAPFGQWVATDNNLGAFTTLLAGSDRLIGSTGADVIHGYGGNDVIYSYGGADSLFGGDGNDLVLAAIPPGVTGTIGPSSTYLRGEAGDDYIAGGPGFDDINGNQGNDTASGGAGDDWVVGGKDNDMLYGDAGFDIVYGNLGNDTCVGGDGADWVRGGQGDDSVYGGAGDDWLWGDRGNDTISGGAGADIFHSFGDAGIDRVIDFKSIEGDRVQLDPGTQYTVSQSGADTVIDMVGGAKMILVGVTLSSLPSGWIFVG